ncbi:hypothetical protein [Tolypothrix sp. VBCCA 56010]|uniref:hypothetical protein n=1 Tax=Tolypothrix sp. VBCCA 56010 TaxID=3137731 RepID=UPI003D7E8803
MLLVYHLAYEVWVDEGDRSKQTLCPPVTNLARVRLTVETLMERTSAIPGVGFSIKCH